MAVSIFLEYFRQFLSVLIKFFLNESSLNSLQNMVFSSEFNYIDFIGSHEK